LESGIKRLAKHNTVKSGEFVLTFLEATNEWLKACPFGKGIFLESFAVECSVAHQPVVG
jgi:hypothetical protein